MRRCRVIEPGLVPYADAFALQKREVARLAAGEGDDLLVLLEHPHVITVGRNADGAAIVADRAFIARRGVEIAETDRGGDVTYHGPGQLVGYPLLRLEGSRHDIRRYVHDVEEVLIRALADFGVDAGRHPEHRGVWTGYDGDFRRTAQPAAKIASLGIRISKWVTSHGFALNVATDLSFFSLITPCGIAGCEMTSMEKILDAPVDAARVRERVVHHFAAVFEREIVWESHASTKDEVHVR